MTFFYYFPPKLVKCSTFLHWFLLLEHWFGIVRPRPTKWQPNRKFRLILREISKVLIIFSRKLEFPFWVQFRLHGSDRKMAGHFKNWKHGPNRTNRSPVSENSFTSWENSRKSCIFCMSFGTTDVFHRKKQMCLIVLVWKPFYSIKRGSDTRNLNTRAIISFRGTIMN